MTIDTEKLRALLADAAEMGLKLPVESIGIAVRDIERRELCCLYDEPWGALIAAAVNALPELLDALATAEADRLTLARAIERERVRWERGLQLEPQHNAYDLAARIVAEADAAKGAT